MAKYNRWSFTVSGSRSFPMDMLRYDHCWPEDSCDVGYMLFDARGGNGQRSIRLRGVHPPTEARWLSFEWKVTDCKGERV
jgi:hypothetical protein